MNRSTEAALNRLLRAMERSEQRQRRGPKRFPFSPITLGIGLALGIGLLSEFVPRAWPILQPGGPAMLDRLGGLPGLVWAGSRAVRVAGYPLYACVAVLTVVNLFLGRALPPIRPLFWIASVLVLAADAAIVFLTLRAAFPGSPPIF